MQCGTDRTDRGNERQTGEHLERLAVGGEREEVGEGERDGEEAVDELDVLAADALGPGPGVDADELLDALTVRLKVIFLASSRRRTVAAGSHPRMASRTRRSMWARSGGDAGRPRRVSVSVWRRRCAGPLVRSSECGPSSVAMEDG